MNKSRREFLQSAAVISSGVLAVHRKKKVQEMPGMQQHPHPAQTNANSHAGQRAVSQLIPASITLPVETPDVPNLPHTVEDGVKVFNLVAEPVRRQLLPYKMMQVWGYNGSCPGPTIQANQGDRVRILFDNHLP